jgi:3-(3-hydroxy-phenyl)propionate hydroxylase
VLPVLVVGAGPVGLLCALELARRHVPVIVVETQPGTTLDLRAGTFHPPTLEMLQPEGVADAMLEAGLKVRYWQSRDREYGLIAEWDLEVLRQDTPYPFRLHLEQHRLTPILLDKLQVSPHAQVLFSHEFIGLTQYADEVVATVRHQGDLLQLHGSFLVGADGGRSAVRKSVGIEFEGYTWPERYTVVSTSFDFEPLGYADNAYISDPVQWLALFRMPDAGPPGIWRMTLPVTDALSDEQVLVPAYAHQAINRITGSAAYASYPVLHQSVYRVHQRVAQKFRDGRVLLAGDSAHVNNPLGGFGLNSGIHDAVNLGEKLAQVWLGKAQPNLLDLYQRQRRAVAIEYVQNLSVKNKKNLEEKDPVVRKARFDELRNMVQDPAKARAYLRMSSMISSIHSANAIT